MAISDTYPGFAYRAGELSKFITAAGIVTIMLKDGSIVHHTPEGLTEFLKWLADHKIVNLKDQQYKPAFVRE